MKLKAKSSPTDPVPATDILSSAVSDQLIKERLPSPLLGRNWLSGVTVTLQICVLVERYPGSQELLAMFTFSFYNKCLESSQHISLVPVRYFLIKC